MGTRATIKFVDGKEEYYVYRGHDGYPENVIADIMKVVGICKDRWSGVELGLLVANFMGITYEANARITPYELTTQIHEDESYIYQVWYNEEKRKFEVSIIG